MKFKTTKRDINNNYCYVIELGYCSAQHLLQYKKPIAYTCGNYGWNADVYEIDSRTAIVTGYRPFGNIRVNYTKLNEIEKQAENIVYNRKLEQSDKEQQLNDLLNGFVKYAINCRK